MTYTLETFAAEIESRLDGSYELVYVDYRDEMSEESVAAIVRDDMETFYDAYSEWETEARWISACDVVADIENDVLREIDDDDEVAELRADFPGSMEELSLRELVQERDNSDWVTRLARNTPAALLRITALDEDNGYAFEEIEPAEMLGRLGVEATAENVETVRDTLAECSPEFSVCLAYWIVGADVESLISLGDASAVELVNPYLYVGNPFAGSGWISERPIVGTVRVPRAAVRTDKDAFGYSVTEVFGGIHGSQYAAEIRPAAEVSANG